MYVDTTQSSDSSATIIIVPIDTVLIYSKNFMVNDIMVHGPNNPFLPTLDSVLVGNIMVIEYYSNGEEKIKPIKGKVSDKIYKIWEDSQLRNKKAP